MPRRPVAPWPKAIADLQTGDLIFFRGNGWESRLIQWVTGSLWSHVAMVVEPTDLDPNSKETGLLLWEATSVPGDDFELGPGKTGPMLCRLNDRLEYYVAETDTILFSVRYLHTSWTPAMRKAIADFIKDPEVRNSKYPESWEVIWYFFRDRVLRGIEEHSYYCSELVAATYTRAGILPTSPSPQSYCPKDFSERGFIPRLLRSELGQELHMADVEG